MQVYVKHDEGEFSVEDLVKEALGPLGAVESVLVAVKQVPGEVIEGRNVDWFEWELRPGGNGGQANVQGGSSPLRAGLVAIPDGSMTAYVVGHGETEIHHRHRYLAAVTEFAALPDHAPMSHPTKEIVTPLWDFYRSLEAALGAAGAFSGAAAPKIGVTRHWVQVTVGDATVLATPEGKGARLELNSEVYVNISDDSDATPEECEAEAERTMEKTIAPDLAALGFVLDDGSASCSEQSNHDGSAVQGWTCITEDIEQAVKAIVGLATVQTCIQCEI